MPERIVLASASSARARLLHAAGVVFAIDPANIDEEAIKATLRQDRAAPLDCAAALARAKAATVSARNPDACVIGADQVLAFGDIWFDKPGSIDVMRRQLVQLRGRMHTLATAVCLCRNGKVLWQAGSEPRLTMRAFSDRFLDDYLDAEGEAVLGSVGAYHLEGRGVQMFEAIEGDHFAIQGLPLLELLAGLRRLGAISA